MGQKTINQTNYQITQTGGKLDMSTSGAASAASYLGYGGIVNKAFERSIKHYITPERLKALRVRSGN